MRKDLYQEMYKLEEKYWWHVAKRRLVKKMLAKNLKEFWELKLVDVGCGTGKFLEEMQNWRKWKGSLGLDGSTEALNYCKKRGVKEVKKADFESRLPIRSSSVSIVTSLDVVEHVKNDQKLIGEFYRILEPGGKVIVTVPAYKWLWTYWDEVLGHKRRYERGQLEQKFEKEGFEIEKISYFYSYLLPVAFVFRLFKSFSPKTRLSSDFIKLPKMINKFLLLLSQLETLVIEKINLPFGLSIVCVARKK